MPRESYIEVLGTRALEENGWTALKVGTVGWPDRLMAKTVGSGCWPVFFLLEWKTPTGRLTMAQKRRIPKLRGMGWPVAILSDHMQARLAGQQVEKGFWRTSPLFTEGV